jgi:hypothetical protein
MIEARFAAEADTYRAAEEGAASAGKAGVEAGHGQNEAGAESSSSEEGAGEGSRPSHTSSPARDATLSDAAAAAAAAEREEREEGVEDEEEEEEDVPHTGLGFVVNRCVVVPLPAVMDHEQSPWVLISF